MYYTTGQYREGSITIRLAHADDTPPLRRLAERDSASVPAGELLVGIVDGQMRAAVSISGGSSISDPFHPTLELVGLLSERAAQLRGERRRGLRSRLGRRLGARRPRSISPQPAGTLRAFD
jgi:hypothetical protein